MSSSNKKNYFPVHIQRFECAYFGFNDFQSFYRTSALLRVVITVMLSVHLSVTLWFTVDKNRPINMNNVGSGT